MIHIPTIDEQISFCTSFLYSCALKQTRKKITPEAMNVNDKVFIATVNQILKEPLSEDERYYFKKNVLNKNKELLIKSIEYEKL